MTFLDIYFSFLIAELEPTVNHSESSLISGCFSFFFFLRGHNSLTSGENTVGISLIQLICTSVKN